jgi:hypothetical protein
MIDDEIIQVPAHELICRELYTIANNPDASVRGASTRANRARKMILDRLVGKRRAGSHPATREGVEIEFIDLTGPPAEIGPGEEEPNGQAEE